MNRKRTHGAERGCDPLQNGYIRTTRCEELRAAPAACVSRYARVAPRPVPRTKPRQPAAAQGDHAERWKPVAPPLEIQGCWAAGRRQRDWRNLCMPIAADAFPDAVPRPGKPTRRHGEVLYLPISDFPSP